MLRTSCVHVIETAAASAPSAEWWQLVGSGGKWQHMIRSTAHAHNTEGLAPNYCVLLGASPTGIRAGRMMQNVSFYIPIVTLAHACSPCFQPVFRAEATHHSVHQTYPSVVAISLPFSPIASPSELLFVSVVISPPLPRSFLRGPAPPTCPA
jgi:hypothetical protein